MSICFCSVSKLFSFTSTETLSTRKTYGSLPLKPPLFSSIIGLPRIPRFQRPIRATTTMEAGQSVGTSTAGNTSTPPMNSFCGDGCWLRSTWVRLLPSQDVTSAAMRACRDAISSNSIPAFRRGVPHSLQQSLDIERVKSVFPYGKILNVEVVDGGLLCSSGVVVEEMGDKNDDCYIVNAAVYLPLLSQRLKKNISISPSAAISPKARSSLLHCSFLPSSSSSLSFPSSFSGLSLGTDFGSNNGVKNEKGEAWWLGPERLLFVKPRGTGLGNLWLEPMGSVERMRTTSGRAILKRRRAKGRKVLCTKSNPNSGKR
ncbi:3R-hydroxymyristoyl- dehydratase-hydroxymyristoyl ACP dehydrase isoform 3 [Hibiscus syriacus]|uniref:3R-hydroxymyristoyl-dehydratase-hydroxymyristoyl ACP dehydrase isoform 3 n=1 Tax=Hibiscus syriacus TaxID=106335 RepID=A0A6A3BEG1_HIBSY|nr:3R-hydroxymyristoyl- dehydratase-hydroxymyristoyl ACP dehydrase isoform 3 [Hibiscus syriacus]